MYTHKVQYYETDKMGITHHSNYIRWMEEARIDFLDRSGWNYRKLEEEGIISPVVGVSTQYKKTTTFDDVISIEVEGKEFKGVKLVLAYTMKDQNGQLVCSATSEHCFVSADGRIMKLKSEKPEFYEFLVSLNKA